MKNTKKLTPEKLGQIVTGWWLPYDHTATHAARMLLGHIEALESEVIILRAKNVKLRKKLKGSK